jgi:hypothetical protein
MQSQQRNGPGADVTSTAAARQALEQQRRRPEARALSRDEEDYFAEVCPSPAALTLTSPT